MKIAAAPFVLLAGLIVAAAAPSAFAADVGTTTFNVQNMTFDMWCQDTQRYPYDRCEVRRAEDVRDFEAYRSTVENYEIQYLQDRDRDQQLQLQLNRDYSVPAGSHTTGRWPN